MNLYQSFPDQTKEIDDFIGELQNEIKAEYDEVVKQVESLKQEGDINEAKRIIQHLRDRVDADTQVLLDQIISQLKEEE